MNHYPRHCGDWLKDTIHLSEVEECIYSRMVDAYYTREAPLPLDLDICCRMVRASSKEAKRAIPSLLREFFTESDDGWHNKRCDAEIVAYRTRSDQARENGRLGGRPANQHKTQPVTDPVSGSDAITKTSRKPVTNTSKAEPKTVAAAPLGVRQEVWDSWIRQRGKKLTPDAVALQSKQLANYAALGDDPNEVIEQSIRNTWAGLFPIKRTTSNRAGAEAVTAAIWGANRERPDTRDISGESERVA
jgi:uncharacterized protein YdaU (DUF1376 family)